MIERILEPEIMDDPAEVDAYDKMDHEQVNQRFVRDLLESGPMVGHVLDVGTGTARIPILLCQEAQTIETCIASDASQNMLDVARINVENAGLTHRIQLQREDSKNLTFPDGRFECLISNSLIHHLPEPKIAITEMVRVTKDGGRLFLRDLMRPESMSEIEALLALHASGEPASSQLLFVQSLSAALTLDEIRSIVADLGFDRTTVQATSDRHWTWDARKAVGD